MPERHPLNAPGPFYVEDGVCIWCAAPSHVAPDLMSSPEEMERAGSCYFKKQPTRAETIQAVRAVQVSCCGGLRYCGNDPEILDQLSALGRCDELPDAK